MPPNLPTMFIPKRPRVQPPTPISPQQRFSQEEWKREMIQGQPELYQNESKYGPIPGIPVGTTWRTREECSKARMHTHTTAGISGGKGGAYSIVMSGGYPDADKGDVIVYTGAGGFGEENRFGGGSRSWGNDVQIGDQSFEHSHNSALVVSCELKKPVRVIRGHQLNSKYAPAEGYRYDGIYRVIEYYPEKSKDGFEICRFKLHREPGQPPIPTRWN